MCTTYSIGTDRMAGDDVDDDVHDDNYDDDVTCGLLDGFCQFPCLCIRSMDK